MEQNREKKRYTALCLIATYLIFISIIFFSFKEAMISCFVILGLSAIIVVIDRVKAIKNRKKKNDAQAAPIQSEPISRPMPGIPIEPRYLSSPAQYFTTVRISNTTNQPWHVPLFHSIINELYLNGVEIMVLTRKELGGKVIEEMQTTYEDFCKSIKMQGLVSKITKVSHNSRLQFYYLDIFKGEQPLTPSPDVQKEFFIVDERLTIRALVYPGEMFEIEFENKGIKTFTFDFSEF